jgi:hypothetical protein
MFTDNSLCMAKSGCKFQIEPFNTAQEIRYLVSLLRRSASDVNAEGLQTFQLLQLYSY